MLLDVFLEHGAPPSATQALLAAGAGQHDAVPIGILHEYKLLAQDAELASTQDSEGLFIKQVVMALASFLDPSRVGRDEHDAAMHASCGDLEIDIPEEFLCPISHELMMEPVTLEVFGF